MKTSSCLRVIYVRSLRVLVIPLMLSAMFPSMRANPSAASGTPPNVLLIISDDLCSRIGCYGDPIVQTPNIDRLATSGVRFDRAYCQFPLCGPSRASFLTGRRPDNLEVYDVKTNFRQKSPHLETVGQMFQRASYYVARVGKIFHYDVPAQIGTNGMDDAASWQERINPRGRDKDDEDLVNLLFGKPGKLGAVPSYLAADGEDEEQTDGKIATATINLLRTHRDKPFFIACGFFRPHVPCVAPKKYYRLYDQNKIVLPPSSDTANANVPTIAFHRYLPDKGINLGLTDAPLIQYTRGYFASTSFMDAQVGRVLQALDDLKLSSETIVIFISDHGYMLGEHGQWGKQSLFEESTRVPLIVRSPAAIGNGKICPRPVELVDLFPTLAELCRISPPTGLEGQSLVPWLNDPNLPRERPAISQQIRPYKGRTIMGRSVRTEQWRYTEWDEGRLGAELYDHASDPQELVNLAKKPESAPIIASLRGFLGAKTPQ